MIQVELTTQDNHQVAMVHINAELTAATVDEFRKELALLMGKGVRFFVLNMDAVDFVDSTGLGAIISITKRVRDLQGDIKLASMQPSAKKLIEVVRADRYFPSHESIDDALKAISLRLAEPPPPPHKPSGGSPRMRTF